jgi:acetyltransferase EpsM
VSAQPLVLIGGGEHARVVIEAARTRPELWTVEGFLDPRPCEDTQRRLGVNWLGDDHLRDDVHYVLGVGEVGVGELRQRILAKYAGARFATIVDARAHVSPTARFEPGAVVFAGAVVHTGAHVGMHALIGTGVIVEHDVTVGNFAQLGPGAVVGGGARIDANSYIGLGARIRDHVMVGAGVMVAMGAVVTANVGAGATVLGVPARAR